MTEDMVAVVVIGALGVAALAYLAWIFRHQHQWGEPVKITEAAPSRTPMQVDSWFDDGSAQWMAERFVHGSVTYEQRCTRCGKTRTYEVLGSEAADD
jgi:hypothetical protein